MFCQDEQVIESNNGVVEYSIISGGRNIFSIDKKSGRISLIGQLDREEKSQWVVSILLFALSKINYYLLLL